MRAKERQIYASIQRDIRYRRMYYTEFDYSILRNIFTLKRAGAGDNPSYNNIIIMADTETSKKRMKAIKESNHVCAWSVALYAFDRPLVTLIGDRPSELMKCFGMIHQHMNGEKTVIYFHNMSYDYTFLRQYLFKVFGYPVKQLNTKPHYPISMEFANGIILKDSLILAQRSILKWAKDLGVEHQKQVGKWDYDKIRNQGDKRTSDEDDYIECDVLAGVECLAEVMHYLKKNIYSIPLTATGIPREQVRIRGEKHGAHDAYVRMAPDWVDQLVFEDAYHGGYVHANRHFLEYTITELVEGIVKCFDFSSSYPFCMLAFKYPCEAFRHRADCSAEYIFRNNDEYAYVFKFKAYDIKLKDPTHPMPALQYSKCKKKINAVLDNGRILKADYVEIYLTDIDLEVIDRYYTYKTLDGQMNCQDVMVAAKDYLPRWFTDYVYECYKNKCELKGGDPVAYAIAKTIINALYGMCVQKPVKENIIEDYETGDYKPDESFNYAEEYEKHVNRQTSILPYQWGMYVTSYAFRNLFELGECCETWLYSDTDSCYGINWDMDKVNAYNDKCKALLRANGYDAVVINGREFWLGIAEHDPEDDTYKEFRFVGAKRYCGRHMDGSMKLTVAGVPKDGVKCLNDDINNFTAGSIFSGTVTGKKMHAYIYADMHIDENGNEVADSIDLSPCDYVLNNAYTVELNDYLMNELMYEEVEMQCDL